MSLNKVSSGRNLPEDMQPLLLAQIPRFFKHYKDLESGKSAF